MALAPRQLGLVDYASTFAAMQDFTAARNAANITWLRQAFAAACACTGVRPTV